MRVRTLAIGSVLFVACGVAETDNLKPRGAAPGEETPGEPPAGSSTTPGESPFDYGVFTSQIQPILDNAENKGCTAAACHGAGIGGVTINREPAAGSAESKANFATVISLTSLNDPESSFILARGSEPRHGGGGSVLFSTAERATMLDWITKAKASAGGVGVKPGCTPPSAFNVGVFRSEIQPILFGQVDLNNLGRTASTGCAKATCHGADRQGALVIKRTATPEENLAAFACYVDLKSPTSSAVLACPLNEPACKKVPHPGAEVWSGRDDLNYQRILSWLFAAKGASTPLDFAFFVRNIEPTFNDQTLGAAPKSCSSNQGCHGVNTVDQLPPNRSNLPILANVSEADKLGHNFNFAQSLNFINFIDPVQSSLSLYATNDIANAPSPGSFSTGLPHGGGEVIDRNSVQARAIATWARGLRPEVDGSQLHWIIAGDYAGIQNITDRTALNETAVTPSIFDRAVGAQKNAGAWDQLSAPAAGRELNFNDRLAGGQPGRVAYAAAYVLNTTSNDLINVRVQIDSVNAVLVYAGSSQIAISNGGQALGTTTFKARSSTRLLVKVFQRVNDRRFAFTTHLAYENGAPVVDDGQIIMKLSPDGEI